MDVRKLDAGLGMCCGLLYWRRYPKECESWMTEAIEIDDTGCEAPHHRALERKIWGARITYRDTFAQMNIFDLTPLCSLPFLSQEPHQMDPCRIRTHTIYTIRSCNTMVICMEEVPANRSRHTIARLPYYL